MTEAKKFSANLADAVASIQGQLDQLIAELGELDGGTAAQDRAKSIKNAITQIAPETE